MLRKYCNIPETEARTVLALMDADDSGGIDFDEFFGFLEVKRFEKTHFFAMF